MNRIAIASIFLLVISLACVSPAWVPTVTPTPKAIPSVTKTAVMETVMETPEPLTAIVKAAAINVRAKPNGEVIAILNAGNTVKLLDKCPLDWCKVQFVSAGETVSGFIFKGCLRLKSELGCTAK
jgi:SH3-like domain-containing protein